MTKQQKYANSSIARKTITIFLRHEHPFAVKYCTFEENAMPSIEFTFEYRFQGEARTITIAPVDMSDLMEIEELIKAR